MKKKLLFIVNVDWFFVSHRLPIALKAQDEGYEIHIACSITSKRQELESHGFNVHDIILNRGEVAVVSELKSLFNIWRVIKKVAPDVMHLVTIKPVIYGGIVSRFRQIKRRVVSISGLGYVFIDQKLKTKILRFFIKNLYRLALNDSNTKVIFQNKNDEELFLKNDIISSCQSVLIRGSGVDLDKFKFTPEPKGKPVVMFLARLLKDKGFDEFCLAASFLKNKNVDVDFVLVGDLDECNPNSVTRSELKRWVSSGIVQHWGYSSNVNDIISKSHIMVLPSYREGLPKSLIEAAACGRAVVTTDVPGCRDAIEANRTGLLVEVKSVESLTLAIQELLDNSRKRQEFGFSGRKLAESYFDISQVVDKHIELYRA